MRGSNEAPSHSWVGSCGRAVRRRRRSAAHMSSPRSKIMSAPRVEAPAPNLRLRALCPTVCFGGARFLRRRSPGLVAENHAVHKTPGTRLGRSGRCRLPAGRAPQPEGENFTAVIALVACVCVCVCVCCHPCVCWCVCVSSPVCVCVATHVCVCVLPPGPPVTTKHSVCMHHTVSTYPPATQDLTTTVGILATGSSGRFDHWVGLTTGRLDHWQVGLL